MSIIHKGIPLTQPQLDAIIPVLNRRPMQRGKRFEAAAEKAMSEAGCPFNPPPRWTPNGFWVIPAHKSSNRYHYFTGARGCDLTLCGKWNGIQAVTQFRENRTYNIPHMDCKECARLFQLGLDKQ